MTSQSRSDDRLERLLDEELRAAMQAPPVDLRAKVLQAIDEGRGTRDVESGFSRIPWRRWALPVASAAVIILGVFVAWRGGVATRDKLAAMLPPLRSTPLHTPTAIRPAAERPTVETPLSRNASHHNNATPFAWDLRPVAADTSAPAEPYLPGAPAGELGDPLRPLPSPPPIVFAPIASAPPISEFARPVTDFPVDNPPAAGSGTAGTSGGTHR
jgi:hypothetical protein